MNRFISQPEKINNKPKQVNNKQNKPKFNLPKKHFD